MKILICGATGTLGMALIKRLYKKHTLYSLSRDEYKAFNLKKRYPKVIILTGDIINGIPKVKNKLDFIINFAAMKHVSFCENDPIGCVRTNILGLQKIIDHCLENDIRLIHASTDKVIEAINTYGASKLIGEALLNNANKIKPLFLYTRCGNIWGSRGSLIEILRKYQSGDTFYISDLKAERYFLKIDTFVNHIETYMKKKSIGLATIYSKKAKIKDVIRAFNPDINIVERGLYHNEKITEKMHLDDNDNILPENYYTIQELKDMFNEM